MSFFFYLKMNVYKDFFQNITHYISKILPSSNNTFLWGASRSSSVSSWLHPTELSNFVDSKLIKLWINALKKIPDEAEKVIASLSLRK